MVNGPKNYAFIIGGPIVFTLTLLYNVMISLLHRRKNSRGSKQQAMHQHAGSGSPIPTTASILKAHQIKSDIDSLVCRYGTDLASVFYTALPFIAALAAFSAIWAESWSCYSLYFAYSLFFILAKFTTYAVLVARVGVAYQSSVLKLSRIQIQSLYGFVLVMFLVNVAFMLIGFKSKRVETGVDKNGKKAKSDKDSVGICLPNYTDQVVLAVFIATDVILSSLFLALFVWPLRRIAAQRVCFVCLFVFDML